RLETTQTGNALGAASLVSMGDPSSHAENILSVARTISAPTMINRLFTWRILWVLLPLRKPNFANLCIELLRYRLVSELGGKNWKRGPIPGAAICLPLSSLNSCHFQSDPATGCALRSNSCFRARKEWIVDSNRCPAESRGIPDGLPPI